MVRAFVLYAEQPDPDTYAEHVELCRRVSGVAVPFQVFFADVA